MLDRDERERRELEYAHQCYFKDYLTAEGLERAVEHVLSGGTLSPVLEDFYPLGRAA